MGTETKIKTIPLNKAIEILESADAVMADLGDTCVMFHSVDSDLTGEDDNEFLTLHTESEGLDYDATFAEGNNRTVEVDGQSLLFMDTEDNVVPVTPLFSRDLL